MNYLKKNSSLLISIFLLISPVIDLLTQSNIIKTNYYSIGLILRGLFLISIIFLTIFTYKKKKLFIPYSILLIYFIIYISGSILYKDTFSYMSPEFKDIINKKNDFGLSIYGEDKFEIYKYDLDNILTFFINGGINLLKAYDFLLKENELNKLTYGYAEFLDLENQTYLFYQNPNFVGFDQNQKKKNIKISANNFPFIINAIMYIVLLLVYIFFLFRLQKIILVFINRLINFNKPSFDLYIKNLDDIKKKLQNEKEEEEKDDLDLNNSDTERRNSKSEDDESIKESKKCRNRYIDCSKYVFDRI